MKKLICVLSSVAVFAALLAGCGASASSAVSDATSAASSVASDATSEAVSEAVSDAVSQAESMAADVADSAKLDAIVAAVEAVNEVPNPRAIDDFSLENDMGLTPDNIVAFKGDVTNNGDDCALVFAAQVKDGTADAVVEELKAYQSTMTGNLYAEFADKVAKAEDARIMSSGNYVVMVIAGINGPDYGVIDTAINSMLAA